MTTQTRRLTTSLMALVFAAGLSTAAHAQDSNTTTAPIAKSAVAQPGGPGFDNSDFEKAQKMSPADREAFFKKKREEFEKMTPQQKEALRAKRKAWFDSLPPEKKEQIKKEHQQMREERMKNMTPEQREKMEKRMQERKEGKGKDGQGWKKPDGATPATTGTSGDGNE